MVNIIVNKDGTLELTPLIANVSDKGIVECLYLSFDKQPGTLAYFIYEDDYGATHTKLVSVNNTVSINSYKSSSLRIQLKIINAATGEAVFESQWSELALSNVNVEPDAGYPQPPVFGPHGPRGPHHDHRPHRNYLYEFCSKLHTAIAVEVTNRETADKQLSEMLLTHITTLNNSMTALSERLDKHISDMKPLVIQGVIQEETDTGG